MSLFNHLLPGMFIAQENATNVDGENAIPVFNPSLTGGRNYQLKKGDRQ